MAFLSHCRWGSLAARALFCAGTLVVSPAERAVDEYRVKAAVLFNLAKFVTWPGEAKALVIGVLGENPFGNSLRGVVEGKTVNGLPVEVISGRSPEEVAGCHILFISASESRRVENDLKLLEGKPILIAGDVRGFAASAGWSSSSSKIAVSSSP
jgi:hypothetical protein